MSNYEIITIAASVLAIIISIFVFFDNQTHAKLAFNRNFRPYVFAINYGYQDGNGALVADIKHLLIITVNAPALIKSQKLSFYKRIGNNDALIETIENKDILIYPSDRTQHSMGAELKIVNNAISFDFEREKLIRIVEIEYTWIDRKIGSYFFKAEHEYINATTPHWLPLSSSGD